MTSQYCALPGCGVDVDQPDRGSRRYCCAAHRAAARAHRARARVEAGSAATPSAQRRRPAEQTDALPVEAGSPDAGAPPATDRLDGVPTQPRVRPAPVPQGPSREPVRLRSLPTARARRSQTVIAAGLVLAMGLGGSVLMWDPQTAEPAPVAERPDLPLALVSWSTSARMSLTSVEKQLHAANSVLARWRAVPTTRRPNVDPPAVRDLLDRMAALERQRLALGSQLSTWQSMRDTEALHRDVLARLAEIDRARAEARDAGAPSVSALDIQRDVLARQAELLRSQLEQWRRDVDAAVRGPLPDVADNTTPLSSRVDALIDRRGPGEAPVGVSPDVLAQALPVRKPIGGDPVSGARVAAGGAPNPGLDEVPVRGTPAGESRAAPGDVGTVPGDVGKRVGQVTDDVAAAGAGVTDTVLPPRGSAGAGAQGARPVEQVTDAVDDLVVGSGDDAGRGPVSAVDKLAGRGTSNSEGSGSGLSGTVVSTVGDLTGETRGSGDGGTHRDPRNQAGSGTASSNAATDRAGSVRAATGSVTRVLDVLDDTGTADRSPDDETSGGSTPGGRDRVTDLVDQAMASAERDGAAGDGTDPSGDRSGASRGTSRSGDSDPGGSASAAGHSGGAGATGSDGANTEGQDRPGRTGRDGAASSDGASEDESGADRSADRQGSGDSGDEGSGDPGDDGPGDSGGEAPGDPGDEGSGDSDDEGTGGSGDEGSGDSGDERSGDSGDEGSGDSGDEGSGDSGDEGSGDSGDEGSGDSGDEGSGDSGDEGSGDPGDEGSGSRETGSEDVGGDGGSADAGSGDTRG